MKPGITVVIYLKIYLIKIYFVFIIFSVIGKIKDTLKSLNKNIYKLLIAVNVSMLSNVFLT